MRILRTAVQLFFLAGVVTLMVRGLAGLTPNTCETYCPFGGLVALYPLVRYRAYTCALTELNVSLLVSLVVLTVATKKSFCGWICPLGTVQEWVGRLGTRVLGRRLHLPAAPDRFLVLLRYAVLALVVVLTYTVWQFDLGFRAYDPFYILFTGLGHETAGALSISILVGVLAAAFFVPFAWCRYLCPLGATIDPLSRAGALRVRRNGERCTGCGACDAICPHRIPVSRVSEVTARNCTNCLDCVEECPEEGALELSWFGK
jgi:polyferredoxin